MTDSKPPSRPDAAAVEAVVAALRRQLGDRCVTTSDIRRQHGHTLTWIANQPPDAVVYPRDAAEAAAIVKLCAAGRAPIIPFGAGTSLEGHVNAPYGGVCVDTSLMKAVLSVQPEDLTCVVEPGVTRKQLNEHLRDTGLFFPIDPGADATIGGMTATRASGTNAVRYGTMKDNVLALEVISPSGEIVTTARRAKKTSAGYDLTRLYVGSEGTLGLITRITLRLHGVPEAISAAVCSFPSIKAACDATIQAIQTGLPMARIELLDELQVKACNRHSKLSLPERPLLLLEFHGTTAGVAEQVETFSAIARDNGGSDFQWASKPEDRSRLWEARHNAYWATLEIRPGAKGFATDVCVPISRLAECVEETKRDLDASGLIGPIVGHVGDGNFHVQPLIMVDDPQEIARAEGFLERLAQRAIGMEGTCTGEHGVGQGKIKYIEGELGSAALATMRAIKHAIDPLGIMNPGKIVSFEP